MFKKLILILISAPMLFCTGCLGGGAQSVYERAIFAANATIDLERTADSTQQILNRYEKYYSQAQFTRLEGDFSGLATRIASDPNLSSADRARYTIDLYRQYGNQRSRLERELLMDQAKGDMIVNNIRGGAQDIKTLQFAEELESASERDLSKSVGDLIVNSAADIAHQAEVLVAQREADEAMRQALENLEETEEHGEEPPVAEPVE